MPAGCLIIVSAPSGSGKTSLLERVLREIEGVRFSISHTTRQPREGEQSGKEYFFVSPGEFDRMIERGEFLEYANVYGSNQYGTSSAFVQKVLEAGQDVVLDIDVQGARQIRRKRPDAVLVFVLPPAYHALEERLRRRNLDSPQVIENRLRAARDEIDKVSEYDYVVVNDDIERSVAELKSIILAERCRRQGRDCSGEPFVAVAEDCRLERRRSQVDQIVETFHV